MANCHGFEWRKPGFRGSVVDPRRGKLPSVFKGDSMNTAQLKIIEQLIDESKLLSDFEWIVEQTAKEAATQIHSISKALTKVSNPQDYDDAVAEAYSRLDEKKEEDLKYWLKTVMFNRLHNRLDSMVNKNIEEQMERL